MEVHRLGRSWESMRVGTGICNGSAAPDRGRSGARCGGCDELVPTNDADDDGGDDPSKQSINQSINPTPDQSDSEAGGRSIPSQPIRARLCASAHDIQMGAAITAPFLPANARSFLRCLPSDRSVRGPRIRFPWLAPEPPRRNRGRRRRPPPVARDLLRQAAPVHSRPSHHRRQRRQRRPPPPPPVAPPCLLSPVSARRLATPCAGASPPALSKRTCYATSCVQLPLFAPRARSGDQRESEQEIPQLWNRHSTRRVGPLHMSRANLGVGCPRIGCALLASRRRGRGARASAASSSSASASASSLLPSLCFVCFSGDPISTPFSARTHLPRPTPVRSHFARSLARSYIHT